MSVVQFLFARSNVIRFFQWCLVVVFASVLGGCHRPEPLPFKSAFGSVGIPPSGIMAEALDVPGRDSLRYGRLEGSGAEIQSILHNNNAEMRGDPEKAAIELMEIQGVADTVGGFPPNWLSASEVARDWGHLGDFGILLCSDSSGVWVIYLTDS